MSDTAADTILPPYAAALGIVVLPGEGPPVLTVAFGPDVVGRPGFLHGGAIAGLLEVAAAAVLDHALDVESSGVTKGGARVTPVTVTVDYMRGGRDRPTFASAMITRLGRRVANVEAFAWQDDRTQPIATARMNYLLVRPDCA